MKMLNQFLVFDTNAFFEEKTLFFLEANEWTEHEIKNDFTSPKVTLGTKVSVLIIEDNTLYRGEKQKVNLGEKFIVKVREANPSDFSSLTPMSSRLVIENVEKATVYGDYNNNLSIIAEIEEV